MKMSPDGGYFDAWDQEKAIVPFLENNCWYSVTLMKTIMFLFSYQSLKMSIYNPYLNHNVRNKVATPCQIGSFEWELMR